MYQANLPLYRKPPRSPGRWRWWHVVEWSMWLIASVVATLLFVGLMRLTQLPPEIRIDVRHYPSEVYKHLSSTTNGTTVPQGTRLYHVTKEFGPATMGGMGTALTAMASVQQSLRRLDVGIIMPHYSFLAFEQAERVIQLSVKVNDKGNWRPIHFHVTKIMYDFGDPTIPAHRRIAMYLIGPGEEAPFDELFRATDRSKIYDFPRRIPYEWVNLYFVKAAATFLKYQAKQDTISQIPTPTPRISVAQIHGATNALIADLLRKDIDTKSLTAPVATVYTMHDYFYEVTYSVTKNNLKVFYEEPSDLEMYTQGYRVFTSALGIDSANVVTFVSRTMATSIIAGQEDFHLKELIMGSLLDKAEQNRFFGISNGLDFGSLNPFDNKQLAKHHLNYPPFALRLVEQHLKDQLLDQVSYPIWKLSEDANDHVVNVKDGAKQWLIDCGILLPEDKQRALVLYVGRFEWAKGLEMFEDAADYFSEHNMKFLIIGQPNNYPEEIIRELEKRLPGDVLVMSTVEEQAKWLVFARAAADFVFVPSKVESFGLVAAEGMLFGAPVISTGVGGLKEFLVDRPVDIALRDPPNYNAYLFSHNIDTKTSLQQAIEDAAEDYAHIMTRPARREKFLLKMISSAFALSWTRLGGPAEEYMSTYAIALRDCIS